MAEQIQNAFQKQHLFQNAKAKGASTVYDIDLEEGREGKVGSRTSIRLGGWGTADWVVWGEDVGRWMVDIDGGRPQERRSGATERVVMLVLLFEEEGDEAGEGGKKVTTKTKRWYKDVGLGFRTPAEAINGTYIDKKCPFTGDVSIRGRILTGVVHSTKMTNTIIIRRDYLHFIPKYRRYEKRHKNLAAHCSPAFRVETGDQVTVGQCRPLSKTVRFNVLRVSKNKAAAKAFQKF